MKTTMFGLCTLLFFSCNKEDFPGQVEGGTPCDYICFGISPDGVAQTKGGIHADAGEYTSGRFVLRSTDSADTLCMRAVVSDGIGGAERAVTRGTPVSNLEAYDEFHVVFENEQSGVFFNSAWRQFRKRGAYPTAITQNVEYLLDSVQASTMLSNSEFIVMLNQAASDREKLAKLLNISKEQMSYVTNADAGCGLIRYGSALVPFINRFPRDTKLYELMTTKPGEGVFGGEKEAM